MKSVLFPLMLALGLLSLTACQQGDGDEDAGPASSAAPAVLVAPTNGDDTAWKEYLGKVVGQHMEGVTDRVFPYYLPANSTAPSPEDQEGKSQYDRQLENVSGVMSRTVLPGNMLAFGSPDSTRMADLIVAAAAGGKPDSLKGSQVLFIGSSADSARVQAAIEALGGKYIFVEAK